ncbi:MAG: lipopolysaccharide biosynthesis protein [Muribaculaceae bacterium]|nr:lipopolysaccharide biosynthesis protein [Muribaculaceae bacterium]
MTESNLKQKTAKGLLWGGIGSGGMQLLNLAFGIILSRILSPGDYGVVGALTVFSAVATIFSESGFTLAIVNRKNISDTDYSSVFWFNLVVGAFFYTILFFLAEPIARFYRTPDMVPLARFLFLSFFIGAIGTAPSGMLLRNLKIKQRSQCLLAAVATSGIAGVDFALAGYGYWGIAVQTVIYSLTYNALLWRVAHWRPSLKFSMTSIRSMLPFSVKQMAVALFTHFNNNFFAVLLGRFYGMVKTGYYTQGNKWTTMGSSILSSMIYSVGQPVMRQTTDDPERLRRVFRKMLRFVAFFSFPAMFGLGIISREFIVIAVTDKWLPAVAVMQILCVGSAFLPITTLYGNLFNSINRPVIYMWNTIAVGSVQTILAIVTYRFGLNIMLTAYVITNIAWLAVWQYFAWRSIGIRLREVLTDTVPYMAVAASVMAIAIMAAAPVSNIILSLIIKIAVAAVLYFTTMWLSGSAILRETISYLRKKK